MICERLTPGELSWKLFGADHLARYHFAAGYAAGKRILDAGTGLGYGAAILSTAGATAVRGVDISAESIARAAALFQADNLSFAVDDCNILAGSSESFDVICSFENIEHLSDPAGFLAAAAVRLSPGGILLCSTPDRAASPPPVQGRPANPYHTIEWSAEEFEALLRTYFHSVEMHVQVRRFALVQREAIAGVVNRLFQSLPMRLAWWVRSKLVRWPVIDMETVGIRPAPEDFPILPRLTASLYGDPQNLVAVCREPR